MPPGFPPLLLPFALQPSPAEQAVPTMAPGSCPDLGPGSQGWKDPKEGSPCPEQLQVCCPETPPLSRSSTPGEQKPRRAALCKTGHERVRLSARQRSRGSHLSFGGREGVSIPSLRRAGSEEKRSPRSPAPCPAPRPLAHPQLFGCTIYLPLTQSRWWHLPANISDL